MCYAAPRRMEAYSTLTMSLVKKNLVQSRCMCLYLSFTLLILVRGESSVKKFICINICKHLKHFETLCEISLETVFIKRKQV